LQNYFINAVLHINDKMAQNLYVLITGHKTGEKMQKDTGFTLIELMVVIAIIAILALVATPNMISWRNNAKLNGDALNLKGDLEMAKSRAITENARVAVLFNANGYTIFVDNGAAPDNFIREADELLLKTRQLSDGVTIDLASTTFVGNQTRFTGRGRLDTPNPSEIVMIENSAGTKSIVVLMVGRISVQ
jgi:type II secretion system protein H